MVSLTVTIAPETPMLPMLSVAERIILFAPRFEQSNESFDSVNDFITQLSLELLLICEGVIVAFPVLSK